MKKIYLLGLALATLFSANAQDCSTGRYATDVFTGSTVTSGIKYGENINFDGTSQELFVDIYQPIADTETERALIIFIHGGSFVGGSRTGADVVPLAQLYAKKGYVTSSISYRLGMKNLMTPSGPGEAGASEAVMRATQDAKAAIRFFKKSVADGNAYGIDTTKIFLVGSSAGGFVALHHAYLDQVSEIPAAINMSDPSLVGGINGNSGTPGHTSDVRAIVNIAGALGDTTWMDNNTTPVLSLHGSADGTVPFGSAMLSLSIFNIMEVDGSESIHIKANELGIKNCFKAEYGADHVPHTAGGEYLDTAVMYITPFLLSEACGVAEYCVCNTVIDPTECHLDGTTGINFEDLDALLGMYPNPAQNEVSISLEGSIIEKIVFMDVNGRIVNQVNAKEQYMNIDISNMTQGVYFVKVQTTNGTLTRKLVIE